jgi:N-acetylglucosamine-1-phosphate uridyltransferase (contains nucleotidyltransferase and I-patch acetyltransferase domains)
VLASRVENPTEYGVFQRDGEQVTGVVEKPDDPPSEMANTGCYRVESRFFDLLEKVEESERGELEITDALQAYIQQNDVDIVEAERWLPCSYPWQLVEANETLLEELEHRVEAEVHDSATIEEPVVLEEGAEVGSNALVKGPAVVRSGAEIGHGSRVRPGTVLMEGSKIGLASEAKNTVLRRGAKLPHLSYAGDSYIGRDANFGAGAVAANLRHDEDSVGIKVKGEILDSGRRKLGAVVGSNARIGVNASIQPGRKVGRNAAIRPGEVVENNRGSEEANKVGIDFDRVLFDTDGFADALKDEFSFEEKTDAHYPGGLYDIRSHARSSGVDPERVIEFAENSIRDFTFDGLHHFEDLDAFVVTRGLRWWQELKVRNSGVLEYVDGFIVVDHHSIAQRDKQVSGIDLLVDDTKEELEAVGCETFHYDHTEHTPRDIVERASELK